MASPVPPDLPVPLPEVDNPPSTPGDIPNDKIKNPVNRTEILISRHTEIYNKLNAVVARWDSMTNDEKLYWTKVALQLRGKYMARFPPQPIAAQPKATQSVRGGTPDSPNPTVVGDDQGEVPDFFIDPKWWSYLESCGITPLPQEALDNFYSTLN